MFAAKRVLVLGVVLDQMARYDRKCILLSIAAFIAQEACLLNPDSYFSIRSFFSGAARECTLFFGFIRNYHLCPRHVLSYH